MLAMLEAPLGEKLRQSVESCLLARAAPFTIRREIIQNVHGTLRCDSLRRSIHTRRGDTSRKISALVKRMGVQVSYWRRRWHWLPAVFPAGCGFQKDG
jgi:hypothetical protein